MNDLLNKLSGDLRKQYNEKLDEVILKKLTLLTKKAYSEMELALYYILASTENMGIEWMKEQLEQKGYELVVEQPDVSFSLDKNINEYSFQMEDIKIKVKKVILEV